MRVPADQPLQMAFHVAGLFAVVVWILYVGQVVLIPVAFAVIAAFLLWQAVTAMDRAPVLRYAPIWLRHVLALVLFMLAVLALVLQVKTNVDQLVLRLPAYQRNIEAMLLAAADRFELDETPSWETIFGFASDRIQPFLVARQIVAIFSDIGGQVALVILYATFLLAERMRFVRKIFMALRDREQADKALTVLQEIGEAIGAYLSAKTTVNVMLGLASFAALWLLGIELAVFWAIWIAVLNYIPYIGSLVGVAFPVLMALAQSGSLALGLATGALMILIQFAIAFAVEPRLIGRKVNLSPFVVLLALSFWTVLWGFAGAVLAIPLTAMFVDVLAALPRTRPIAIMLSNDGRV